MTLLPIAAGRTSDFLNQQRLLTQISSDQISLLEKQEQISTGRRVTTPSDDPHASIRAISLQRLLEQKDQIKTNLLTSDSYLSATDNAISDVANLLIDVRATALSVSNTTSSDVEREAAAAVVKRAIEQLAEALNKEFRGRYLFAGSDSSDIPFELRGNHVVYHGNETSLRSFAELNFLLESNVNGNQVVGAISPQVGGIADLNPIVKATTRVADLRGGEGIDLGSIQVSDGNSSRTIDLASAETVGDIIRLIEAQPPEGRTVVGRVTGNGIQLQLSDETPGNLVIKEAGGGTTASELGILNTLGVGTQPLIGQDLNPIVRPTTLLSDLVGVRAQLVVTSPGDNSNVVLEANERGPQFNDYRFQYVDDDLLQAADGLSAGNETVTLTGSATNARAAVTFSGSGNDILLTATSSGVASNNVAIEITNAGSIGNAAQVTFNSSTRTLTIGVDSGNNTQIQTVINSINGEGTFSAAYDSSNSGDGGFNPTAVVDAADAGVVSGNTGNSGAETNTILVNINAGDTNAEQVVAALQASTAVSDLFQAALDSHDATTAAQAGQGAVGVNATGISSGGQGSELDLESGLQIVNGENTFVVTFESATTVEDVLNQLNGLDANLQADINAAGTGINVRSRLSGADFFLGENGGTTATQLGIRSFNDTTDLINLNHGRGVATTDGIDFFISRNDGSEFGVDVSAVTNIGQVVDLINSHVDNQNPATRIVAQHTQFGNGIDLVNAGTTGAPIGIRVVSDAAVDLGLIPSDQRQATSAPATPASADIGFPSGNDVNTAFQVTANQTGPSLNGYQIEFRDTLSGDTAVATVDTAGKRLIVDLDAANTTSNTIVAAIGLEGTFSAALDTTNDPGNDGSGIPNATGTLATTAGGADEAIAGRDTNPLEVEGAFNSLLRLNTALEKFDLPAISRALQGLDVDFDRVNFARAEIGARQQQVEVFRDRIVGEEIELQETLTNEIDVDLTRAISEMLQRQASYQASLQLMGQTFRLTLLDFV